MTIEEFIQIVCQRPISSSPILRLNTLAKELAEGAIYELWPTYIRGDGKKSIIFHLEQTKSGIPSLYPNDDVDSNFLRTRILEKHLSFEPLEYDQIFRYIFARWGLLFPNIHLLAAYGFIEFNISEFRINKSAFQLLSETNSASIFISYKRSESSAFALLIEDRLNQSGLSAFLDKQLQAGDDWQNELEKQIAKSDYFILILGKETLNSAVTIREISWAAEGKKPIIPIWHNEFVFKAEDWPRLASNISQVLSNTHTIRVIEENPLTYDTAIRELLNRFGISG